MIEEYIDSSWFIDSKGDRAGIGLSGRQVAGDQDSRASVRRAGRPHSCFAPIPKEEFVPSWLCGDESILKNKAKCRPLAGNPNLPGRQATELQILNKEAL